MEDSSMWIMLGAAGAVIFAIVVYVAFMIFLPEWVGITGKVALEAERSHRGGEPGSDDVIDKLHGSKPNKDSKS